MKLTNKQIHNLNTILYHIERAHNYLSKDEVVGIAHKTNHPNGVDYRIINPDCIDEKHGLPEFIGKMDKEIGSDIAGLSMAISQLRNFISMNSQ